MKWIIDDDGSYDSLIIREATVREGHTLPLAVCRVYSPCRTWNQPTDEDREEMLATAREIVEAHNARE